MEGIFTLSAKYKSFRSNIVCNVFTIIIAALLLVMISVEPVSSDETKFSSYSNEVCPPAADLGKCTCALTTDSTSNTVTINCKDQNLGDSAVETLVGKITWAAIDTIDLSGNLLTKVPTNLAQLTSVTSLSLASNGITSIGSFDLELQATIVSLDLSNNLISSIAVFGLPVNYVNGSVINLSNNGLKSLDQNVFEPILQSFSSSGFDPTVTYIDASSNSNLDCGLANGEQCGSEQWLFSNPNLLPYAIGTCQNGNEFSSYSQEVCLCPPAADLGNCTCALTTDSTDTTVTINCKDQNLDDSAAEILVGKITWAPIDTLILDGNNMTKIPAGLSGLTQLSSLSAANNAITYISDVDLSPLAADVRKLNFASNFISTVAPGSFPSKFVPGAQIILDGNPLTSLTQDAFEPVIKNFIANGYSNSDTFISLADTNQFDCDANTCGSESWLVTNSEYQVFVQGAPKCSDGTALFDLTSIICWCPPSVPLATCSCDLTTDSSSSVTVDCTSQGLGDEVMASVLLNISVTTPLDTLLLGGNNLTRVPSSSAAAVRATSTSLLTRFPVLNYVSLSSNAITSILKGDLTLTAPLKFLDLSANKISRVAVGSLPSSFVNGAQILLDSNNLTGLNRAVFQPIFDYFVKNGFSSDSSFISLSNNPINCNIGTAGSSSVCYRNIGWLISSSSCASFVQNAKCADGTNISEVNKASCSQTPAPTSTTPRPWKRKPFLEILAVSWVHSILSSIFNNNS